MVSTWCGCRHICYRSATRWATDYSIRPLDGGRRSKQICCLQQLSTNSFSISVWSDLLVTDTWHLSMSVFACLFMIHACAQCWYTRDPSFETPVEMTGCLFPVVSACTAKTRCASSLATVLPLACTGPVLETLKTRNTACFYPPTAMMRVKRRSVPVGADDPTLQGFY